MVWLILDFVHTVIGMTLVYLFIQAFLYKKSDAHIALKISTIAAVMAVIFFTTYYFLGNVIAISTVLLVSAFVIGKVCFKSSAGWAAITAIFTLMAGMTSEFIATLIFIEFQTISLPDVIHLNAYRLQARTLSHLFFLIIIALTRHFRAGAIDTKNVKLLLAPLALAIVSIVLLQQLFTNIYTVAAAPAINELVPVFSIIILNILNFAFVENLVRQNEKSREFILVKAQNDIQQSHIEQLIETQKQIVKISHDFRQQTNALLALCTEQRYAELQASLSELANIGAAAFIIRTQNPMLDAVLSSKKEEAEKSGIAFNAELNVRPGLPYISISLCVLLGNALDNAIEACNRACNRAADNKLIDMVLTATETKFMFRMKNTLGETPLPSGEFLKTKKPDKLRHGIGLQSMKQTCTELGGDMTFEYDEEYFRIWIYIPVANSPQNPSFTPNLLTGN